MSDSYGIERRQFRVLYRVFLLRVVDLELLSADGEITKLLGQFAALLAAISFLFTAPLILAGGGLSQVDLWTMAHLLIATTLVVVGLFSALSWDSAFPERRDVLVLAPLPVGARTVFLAKLTALAAALSLSVVALNVFTGLVWPFYFCSAHGGALGALRSMAAYWITMIAAGAFIFCSVLAVQAVVALLLPRQHFLRVSALLQVALFCLFLSVYFAEPSLETPGALMAPENQRLLACLPSYWFLGLFQELNGSMHPAFATLARRAWTGLALAGFGAGAAVLLCHFRTLRKIAEEPDIVPGSHRRHWPTGFGSALQRAVSSFSLRTLLRSRQHRAIFSFYLGSGFAIVLAYVKIPLARQSLSQAAATAQGSVPFLLASILMMCVAVAGMRVVFAMPIALRANWVFRITELGGVPVYSTTIRRSFLLLAVAPVWVASAVLFFSIWPLRQAVGHLAVLGLLGSTLVDLCLYRFQKIPFTCSYLPGKGQIQFAFWACVMLLIPLTNKGAQLEQLALHSPIRYAVAIVVLGSAAVLARWRTAASARSAEGLQFEETPPVEVLALQLHRDGVSVLDHS